MDYTVEVEKAHLVSYVEKAILKYANEDSQPLWETDEEFLDNIPCGTNVTFLLSLCTVPLVRNCVQLAIAYEHHKFGVYDSIRRIVE
jgi:hypothetical protein